MTRTTEKRVRTKALRSLSITETKRERERVVVVVVVVVTAASNVSLRDEENHRMPGF